MISLKTPQEIALMREGGRLVAHILQELISRVRPEVSTAELDQFAEQKIRKAGAIPAFLNYRGFPATLCASVNEEVVHAVPSSAKILQEGDIITLDLGLIHQGYYVDMARTVGVGSISAQAERLMCVAREALQIGIQKVQSGTALGDIGSAIQNFVEKEGFGVVRELCGHGIGKDLHEEPQVLNFGKPGEGLKLQEGMVICIEPMVTAGDWKVKLASDGYTYVTADGSLSAHFEDTVAVTSIGAEVLTNPS